jgi:hypothetical protein
MPRRNEKRRKARRKKENERRFARSSAPLFAFARRKNAFERRRIQTKIDAANRKARRVDF